MELGQRYSVMIKLDREPGSYHLRYATYPSGDDMQQVLEGRSTVSYAVSRAPSLSRSPAARSPKRCECPGGSAG